MSIIEILKGLKALLILILYITGFIDLCVADFDKGLCCLGIATILLEIIY